MTDQFSPEDAAFAEEVRHFIASHYPQEMRVVDPHSELDKRQLMLWHRELHKRGWVAPNWPEEYGGPGWTPMQKFIFARECAAAGTLPVLAFSVTMVGPVIYSFGTEAQKQRFLPGILSGEDWWCQGYSEPGAGSDLASLNTRAELQGDHYIVNGHKTWTTLAQHADWMFLLVRTSKDGPAQAGITFLLTPMSAPGITVRPIITMDGTHEVNDVFLDNVAIPAEYRIGEEGQGWSIAKFLLSNERSGMAGSAKARRSLDEAKRLAAAGNVMGSLKQAFARLEIRLLALEALELRVLDAQRAGARGGIEASVMKILGTELHQDILELQMRASGPYALFNRALAAMDPARNARPAPYDAMATQHYLNERKTSIYGGSNQIQKNIIAKQFLGLK